MRFPNFSRSSIGPAAVEAPIYSAILKTPVAPAVVNSYEPEYTYHSLTHASPILVAKIAYSPAAVIAHTSFETVNGHCAWYADK